MTRVTLRADATSATATTTTVAESFFSLSTHRREGAPPPVIPGPQAYFWTERWQLGERETDQDIASGDILRFGDVDDAIRWLLS